MSRPPFAQEFIETSGYKIEIIHLCKDLSEKSLCSLNLMLRQQFNLPDLFFFFSDAFEIFVSVRYGCASLDD
jgi:hypothetical protein